jgi:hypothetical protein
MDESSANAPEAVPPATTDAEALSALLRSMTTTTTVERFDDPMTTKTTAITAEKGSSGGSALLSEPPESESSRGPFRPNVSAVPTSISRSYKIYAVPTHAFCQIFSDRIVLGVTQLRDRNTKESTGHIGSWVYCQASKSPIDPRQVDYELSTLLGGSGGSGGNSNVRDEKEIYARRISERLLEKKSIPGGTDRIVLLLGISLLPVPPPSSTSSVSSIDRFKVLVEVLVELVEEALGIALG